MREYFTIMVTENSKENLGLLTEKLNAGFFIDDRISVGRSTLMVLQKRHNRNNDLALRDVDSEPTGYYSGSILSAAVQSEG